MESINDSYLMHHGIKGMKWGVRRFENYNGHLTPLGLKRYKKYDGLYDSSKKSDKSKTTTPKKQKNKIDKEKAVKVAKTVAKGAAITAGVLAAGYATKIVSEEFASHKDFKKAQAITKSIMDENFTDLDTASRNVIRNTITKSNYQTLNRQRSIQSELNKSRLRDTIDAYINPKTASVDKRNTLREDVRSKKYNVDMSSNMITKSNINQNGRATGLRNQAESVVNPTLYESKKRKAQQEAEAAYQAQQAANREKARTAFDEMGHKIREDEERKNSTMRHSDDILIHYGIKGMKWGVRHSKNNGTKTLSRIDKRYDKLAKKDAKEFARAKMFYGEGAGNRRKLIKNTVEQRRKENEHYNEAFEKYLSEQDMSKHVGAAKRERRAKDTAKNAKWLGKKAINVALMMSDNDDLYLAHHGIKGMKWGVRRYRNPDGSLTDAGKRRYAIQDARKYYKINRLQRAKEHTTDEVASARLDKRIRKVQTRSDRKRADLSQRDINVGRQIVARNRRNWAAFNTAAKAGLTAAGAYALYQNPKTRALVPLAVAGGAAATLGSAKKLPYYTMEARRYKQVNPKGSTSKGLTKNQKALRKIGKAAEGAALAGATGYALYKTGAEGKLIDAGKNAVTSRVNANRIQNGSGVASKVYSKAKTTAKNTGERVKTAAKEKVKSSIRNRVMQDVDYNDPRTWIKGVNNAREMVGNVKRYAQTTKAVKNKDYTTAAMNVVPDVAESTNKLVDEGKKKVKRIKTKFTRK